MITAPYNFVPLNKEVFYPSWSEQVSHDIPFEDGESGEIDITITPKSPIFIRDHEKKEEFCQHNGEYYIPSASIKGMVRNVLEIMSFSKMRDEIFDDDTYAVRDLRNSNLYMDNMKPNMLSCGWLTKKKNSDEYIIEDCGVAGRIKHEEIDKIFSIDFASKFKSGTFGDKPEFKTAKYKYEILKNKHFVHSFTFSKKDMASREIYIYDKNSTKSGTIVLTGQPSGRNEPENGRASGKIYEFIFFPTKSEISVSKEAMENFKFAYFDKRTTEPKESPDWTYWKKKLEKGEKVPVFFQKEGMNVKHFGLSYLYKLPYTHSVKDGIPKAHFESEDLDLAQTMFGYISKNNKEALKRRVQFSHFKAISNITLLAPKREILGTPRASYYPIYVKQADGKLYKTFMDGDFEIAGRKRYQIHNSNQTTKTIDTGNENVGTTFKPLKDGVIFKGKLRYHNLKRCEIGALLSALTFHNTPTTFHNIGMAKSLGYGKIELKLDGIKDINGYLKEFELTIGEQIQNWASSTQLTELVSMAVEQKNQGNSKLKYLDLPEFAKNKTGDDKDYLRNYTALDNIKTVTIKSLLSDDERKLLISKKDEIQKQREEKAKLEAQAKKEQEEKRKAEEKALIQQKREEEQKAIQLQQQQEKFDKVNQEVQKGWDNIHNPKFKAKLKSGLQNFIKKWSDPKNNQDSSVILALVEQAQTELKTK
jgi:CRISPR-associated protein (TIGR03986 family)